MLGGLELGEDQGALEPHTSLTGHQGQLSVREQPTSWTPLGALGGLESCCLLVCTFFSGLWKGNSESSATPPRPPPLPQGLRYQEALSAHVLPPQPLNGPSLSALSSPVGIEPPEAHAPLHPGA